MMARKVPESVIKSRLAYANALVQVGDYVEIEVRGRRVAGEVKYRDYDEYEDDWILDLGDRNWKSALDGGRIVRINGRRV